MPLTASSSSAEGIPSASSTAPESLLVRYIKAHVRTGDQAKDRSEQHYVAAGRYLITLKASYAPSWEAWEDLLRVKVGLSTGRASELMQIADGKKSVQGIRDATAQRVRALRDNRKASLRNEEEDDAEGPSRAALGPPVPTANDPDPRLRLRARAVIIDLLAAEVRALVIEMVLAGESQGYFGDFCNAITEIYQALSRAGR